MKRPAISTDVLLAVEASVKAGVHPKHAGKPYGLGMCAVKTLMEKAEVYHKGEAVLAEHPLSLQGFAMTGRLRPGHYDEKGEPPLKAYGVFTLHDLGEQGWSPAEVRRYAPWAEGIIELMGEFGLALAPDREKPIDRPFSLAHRRHNAEWLLKYYRDGYWESKKNLDQIEAEERAARGNVIPFPAERRRAVS